MRHGTACASWCCWELEDLIRKVDRESTPGGFMALRTCWCRSSTLSERCCCSSVLESSGSPSARSAGRQHFAGRSGGRRDYRRSLRWQIAAAAAILASGVAMAARLEVFQFAWVNVSLVVLLLIAALAGIVSRSQPRAADLRIGQLWPASVAIRIGLGAWRLLPDGGEARDC